MVKTLMPASLRHTESPASYILPASVRDTDLLGISLSPFLLACHCCYTEYKELRNHRQSFVLAASTCLFQALFVCFTSTKLMVTSVESLQPSSHSVLYVNFSLSQSYTAVVKTKHLGLVHDEMSVLNCNSKFYASKSASCQCLG